MKKFPAYSRLSKPSGFTLVELLVVMAIIAILAAVTMSVGSMLINMAKRAKAANMATQIQTAALGYYTEYSIYPIPTGAAASADLLIDDTAASAANWKGMLYGLCGNINPYDTSTTAPGTAVPNTRAIAFLTLKSSDVDANGGPKNPLAPDATHIYFNMAIDNDYDGIVGDSGTANGLLPDFVNSTTTTMVLLSKGTAGGVVVWANCNGSTTLKNPNFWVHTY